VRSRKSILAVVAALVVLAAAPACGGHSETKASAKRVTIASSNVVVIDRSTGNSASPGIHLGQYFFNFPAHVTVTNKTRVRKLVAALKRLPRFRAGDSRCHPFSSAPKIILRFEFVDALLRRNTVARLTVDPVCWEMTGLGYPRWAAHSPYFRRALGKAVGAPHGIPVVIYYG
jgi:hypothetical protein